MDINQILIIALLLLKSASGQLQRPLHVYDTCQRTDETFCMGVTGPAASFSPVVDEDAGCLFHRNCSHVLHVTRKAGRNRIIWRYHVQSEPDAIGGEFDLAVTHDLIRLSSFKSQGSKRTIPEMPASVPFMRGWVDADGELRSEPFFKLQDPEKPQAIRKNRIFTPLPAEENRFDEDTSQQFNVYSFISRLDDLAFRDPSSGHEVYRLDLSQPVRFTLLAYRVHFAKRGERVKTVLSTMIRNMPLVQLWDDDSAEEVESTSPKPSNFTTRRITLHKANKKYFGHDQIRAFRALPVWQKFALGTMWAICIVLLVIIVIGLCHYGVQKNNNKRRSVSFRREDTQMSQIATYQNGHGNQKLLSIS